MTGVDDGDIAHRVAHALQAVRRGEVGIVEIRGSSIDQEVAEAVVADFIQAFGLDVIVRGLPGGFRVAARAPSSRTIEIEL